MSDTLEIEELVPTIEKIKFSIVQVTQKLGRQQAELNEKEGLLAEKEKELNEQLKRSSQLEFEYEAIQGELGRISDLYSELSGKTEDVTDVKKILGIYITLLEKVFAGKPHAKILFLLHGEKETMTRNDLNQSTGFAAAVVLRTIHELAAADLINWDEEAQTISLKDRIYS